MDLLFRRAAKHDEDRAWEIILQAKAQMARLGSTQWDENYPSRDLIAQDIANDEGFVLEKNGRVVAYGVVSFSGEPVYEQLADKWSSNLPYLVVHRLAVADEAKRQGIARCFMLEAEKEACRRGIYHFRVDTNYDNTYMLRLIENLGFEYRGECTYRGGCVRKAFEKALRQDNNQSPLH